MESWRERGYVPDSDSEDGFDSQGTERVNRDVEGGGESTGHDIDLDVDLRAATAPEPSHSDKAEQNPNTSHDTTGFGFEIVIPGRNAVGNTTLDQTEDPGDDMAPPASDPMELDEPEDEETTPRRLGPAQPSPTLSAAPDYAESPSTPKAQPQKDIWDIPSSSPDELQLVVQPPPRQTTPTAPAQEGSLLHQFDDSNDLSPLSSPPSSLHSIRFDEDEQNDHERPDQLPRGMLEELEELLPLPSEIPEDILQDHSRPVGRRSLRQRNPIQLHPYMLEDAKYRNLMMQRGVKPVRIAQYREALRAAAAAGESQVQDFAPNAESPSSSSAMELGVAPSSPLELDYHSEQIEHRPSTHEGINPSHPVDSSPIRDARASKRRRISKHYGGHGDHSQRPVVVVDNSSPARRFGIPPSPPRSGSASSPHIAQRPNEFIWPRGFSPPPIHTPDAEPKSRDGFANEDAMDVSEPVDHNSSDDRSVASHSPPGSDVEPNGQDTNAVRKFQRRIKGVLPASWLRLDQQKQKDGLPSSTQRNLERAARQENSKDDESDEERDTNAADVDARQILAKFVGSQDPFFEQDGGGDIPEDNRIDYMFESSTRSSGPRKQKLNKYRQNTGGRGIDPKHTKRNGHPDEVLQDLVSWTLRTSLLDLEPSSRSSFELLRATHDSVKTGDDRVPHLRKRTPTRREIDASDSQEAPPLPSPEPEITGTNGSLQQDFELLKGLQRSYSVDFNITPLATGTFFHESTFIGSGEFSASLAAGKRNFDEAASSFHINLGEKSCRWGPWNDTVSSEIGIAFDCMLNHTESEEHADTVDERAASNSPIVYRQLIRYVTENLTFIDPIDRKGFVQRMHGLVYKINDHLMTFIPTTAQEADLLAKLASYNLVFANLTSQTACHDLVENAIANETFELVKSSSRQAIALIVSNPAGQSSILKFLENNRSRAWREAGIRDDQPFVEAYVIVNHVLHSRDNLKSCFEELVTDAHSLVEVMDLGGLKDVGCLENGWQRVYATLPLNEIDPLGITRTGLRFKQPHENWTVVKKLLAPVLGSYDAHSDTQPISYNSYCRALFHRCFHLINGWGWRNCKPILDTLYDFFAKNTLYNLKHEESYSSPAFLDELDRNPSLDVLPGDPCFHILLKIVASGLRFLSQFYDKKKVRNFAWRLLPNHGRVYPKEKPIHQTDLDALRNHHDLLCTLYYAVPDGCRPRIEAIKNLVHPGSSHRETCIISLRSWTRLARFKMSTEEDALGLEPFADWHCYFVAELLKQHGLARKEVESQSTADNQFSHQLIERTIAQNQQQIESLLKTALNSLQDIVQSASTLDRAYKIVSKTPINWVLGLFNSKAARLNATVSEALQVIMAYIEKCRPAPVDTRSGVANGPAATDEDSQEYGDWRDLDFDAICGDEVSEARPEGIVHVEQFFHPAVSRLVSNCFGEDHSPEDAILLAVVDCWTSIAQILVQYRIRHWDSYMSPYDGDSWATLRGTIQTRKFTPRFLASCIEKDAQFVSDCRTQIFGMWMTSLVERVSMLKFQHSLTEALLNRDAQNPILHNLPFSKDVRDNKFSITLEDLSQRRLSLLSSLLSNMRAHIQNLEDTESMELSSTKHEYRELIQTMMSSMKENYKELGNGGTSARGAYVDFVHRVVGFLQQHTRDICPIDPFFTDPATFPLPSTDPTYIVARLKSYEPKLASEKVAKTLIIFVQGVSERAAIDGQQMYLVQQLHASMTDTYEAGDPSKPTLRAILLQSVFPAYLETTFTNPAAWMLSRPVTQSITQTFQELLFHMDTTDPHCVASVVNLITAVFRSSYTALYSLIEKPNKTLQDPPSIITAASFIDMLTSSLKVTDYIHRATNTATHLISQIHAFETLVLSIACTLHNSNPATEDLPPSPSCSPIFTPPSPITTPTTITNPPFFHEIYHSATRELQSYLNESWSRHNAKYYFTRRGGHHPQEVALEPAVAAQLEYSSEVFDGACMRFLEVVGGLGLVESD
ncbi:uncharacterized protein BDW47DRAFT_123721 [Aspergillus candidus]|uniref:Mus7/MMS22 family-domain-containing protein n=1 Tax=Aspergillus candidus TaxID=41067 RepID=A0A2I2FHV5_ASPCN|nr:Mus7/MMS22 family-domain-containing protein [Aspergillus candidus]PLB40211.1 Mus7/MMS22 family-domain-containing protein [Aspergillus candidus]